MVEQIKQPAAPAIQSSAKQSFVCPVCERGAYDYAFAVQGNSICRCLNCHTLASENRPRLPGSLLEKITDATVNHDPESIAALILSTARERGAVGPYLVIATANDASAELLRASLPSGQVDLVTPALSLIHI